LVGVVIVRKIYHSTLVHGVTEAVEKNVGFVSGVKVHGRITAW